MKTWAKQRMSPVLELFRFLMQRSSQVKSRVITQHKFLSKFQAGRNDKMKAEQKLSEKSEGLTLSKKPLLDSGSSNNKGGSASMSKGSVEPIQLPPSFKDAFKYKGLESSELKLDFTFDEELAKLTEEKMENKDIVEAPAPIQLPPQAG